MWFYNLYTVNMVNYTDRQISNEKLNLFFKNKLHLAMVYYPFYIFLDLIN